VHPATHRRPQRDLAGRRAGPGRAARPAGGSGRRPGRDRLTVGRGPGGAGRLARRSRAPHRAGSPPRPAAPAGAGGPGRRRRAGPGAESAAVIRAILFLLIAGALAALAVAAGGDAGRVQADWLGWRLDASAAAVLLLIGVLTLLAVVFWRVTLWLAEAPRRAERAREEARRREADAVLARGFLALAAGDGDQARRQAARAADLYAEPPPPTVALLKAQAAEAAHDPSAEPAW